jgi:hypothetical protein
MYYTIRGFSGQFYGQFDDREAAETYAEREIIGGWDIILIDHQFLLQCLVDVLNWYISENCNDIDIGASVKNSLAELATIFDIDQVLTDEPTEDPLYKPVTISDKDLKTQKEADKKKLERWLFSCQPYDFIAQIGRKVE